MSKIKWKPILSLLLLVLLPAVLASSSQWPDVGLLESTTLSNDLPTVDLTNVDTEFRLATLMTATGGGLSEQELKCSSGNHAIETELGKSGFSVGFSDFSLTLYPEGSVAGGLIVVGLSLDSSAGSFTLGSTAGLTIDSGSASNSNAVQLTGSFNNINAALATLVYTPADGFSGSARIGVYLSGYNVLSSECSLEAAVTVKKIDDIPDPIKCSIKLISLPEPCSDLDTQLLSDIGEVTHYPHRFKWDESSKKDEVTSAYFTINAGTDLPAVRRLLATASPTEIFNTILGLSADQVKGTTYLKYADLGSLEQQCSDGSWRANCSGSSPFSWFLPVVIAASAVGFILLLIASYCLVRKIRNHNANKLAEKEAAVNANNAPLAAGSAAAAKQYLYSAPGEGGMHEFSTSDPKSIHFISEVAIQEKSTSIDPMRASKNMREEELLTEPVLVGADEKAAAELAKSNAEQSKAEYSANHDTSVSNKPKYSAAGSSANGSRHFFYVDENKVDNSTSSANSNSSILAQREESRRNSQGSTAHFKYSDDARDLASKSSSSHLPILPPNTPVSKQKDAFKSTSSLDLSTNGAQRHEGQISAAASTDRSETSSNSTSRTSSGSTAAFVVQANKDKKAPLAVVKPSSGSNSPVRAPQQAN
jgi:hypothetical protein